MEKSRKMLTYITLKAHIYKKCRVRLFDVVKLVSAVGFNQAFEVVFHAIISFGLSKPGKWSSSSFSKSVPANGAITNIHTCKKV
jgi:hypothetical protein